MLRKLAISATAALALSTGGAMAAGGAGEITNVPFSFQGPFGTYDQDQLQRGLQVYTEVCAGCHGLQYVPLRTLADEGGVGWTEDEVRAYIDENFIEVFDEDLQDFRLATPNDNFPANDAVGAPDLSLMAKARTGFSGPRGTAIYPLLYGLGGPEYIYSLLTHYTGEEVEQFGTILYVNETMEGGLISMAPPLWEGAVEYADGTEATESQMAEDVSAFLMWAAEPHMMARKQMGLVAVIILGIFSVLLYLTNKRLWAPVKARAKGQQPAE
ncbi:cytochrome c1 [Hasllibacter sp. MH4015]|uniref:cytochrome c1 n=1 Tax=Hasllibacter sp. MH4015 TaxID=2854029 RepID=UPI001CD2AD21|nr:cytochrome c1 [Hasllibacter sp. MH4015]